MTEQEARGKWCPFARQIVTVEHPIHGATAIAGMNRDKSDRPHGMCIASDCMAWRLGDVHPESQRAADDEFRKTGIVQFAARIGYCGLAGAFRL